MRPMHTYRLCQDLRFEVGHYLRNVVGQVSADQWVTIRAFDTEDAARAEVNYLNGGVTMHMVDPVPPLSLSGQSR